MAKSDEQWDIEDGARTLIRAQEIREDKKFFPKVKKELAKQAKAAKQAALEAGVKVGMDKSFPKDK